MSELDYEAEVCVAEGPPSIENDDQRVPIDSNQEQSELEEGEIKDNEDNNEINNETKTEERMEIDYKDDKKEIEIEEYKNVCKYYHMGRCRYGHQCRFVHMGACEMLPTSHLSSTLTLIQPVLFHHPIILPPLSPNAEPVADAWELGLQKARKLVMSAKDKREKDLEFEEKKLYLSSDEKKIDDVLRVRRSREINSTHKNKHSRSVNLKSNLNLPKKEKKRWPDNHSKHLIISPKWSDPWRRSRSRTRSLSSSPSQSSGGCDELCSSCSQCSSVSEADSRSEKSFPKSHSKLDRVFARTFVKSPSRKRYLLGSVSPPYYGERSLYKPRYDKRTAYKHSKFPVVSDEERKHERRKSRLNSRPKQSRKEVKKRRRISPIIPSDLRLKIPRRIDLDSCDSDMTVSVLSGSTSPVKRPVVSPMNKNRRSDESHLLSYFNRVPSNNEKLRNGKKAPLSKESNVSQNKITPLKNQDKTVLVTKKTVAVSEKQLPVAKKAVTVSEKQLPVAKKAVTVSEKQLPFVKKTVPVSVKQLPVAKRQFPPPKKKEFSTAELELLKYVPKANIDEKVSTLVSRNTKVNKSKPNSIPKKQLPELNIVSKNKPTPVKKLSRREELLIQLRNIEIAIAKRKYIAASLETKKKL